MKRLFAISCLCIVFFCISIVKAATNLPLYDDSPRTAASGGVLTENSTHEFSFDADSNGWQFFTNYEVGGPVDGIWENGQLKINFDKNMCDYSSGEWRYYPERWTVSSGDTFQVETYAPIFWSVGTNLTVFFEDESQESVYYGHGNTEQTNQQITLLISLAATGKIVNYIQIEGHSGSYTCDEERNIYFDNFIANLARPPVMSTVFLPIVIK